MRTTLSIAVLLIAFFSLAGCNTPDALNPTAIAPAQAGDDTTPATALVPAPTPEKISSNVRLQFAPVVGATVEAATPLSKRLSARAGERGLTITAGGADPATHLMKGYFSAISEGRDTIVIFVWDVLGPGGDRLHRIQGQEKIAGIADNAWTVVPAQMMETIADRTIDDLTLWLSNNQG